MGKYFNTTVSSLLENISIRLYWQCNVLCIYSNWAIHIRYEKSFFFIKMKAFVFIEIRIKFIRSTIIYQYTLCIPHKQKIFSMRKVLKGVSNTTILAFFRYHTSSPAEWISTLYQWFRRSQPVGGVRWDDWTSGEPHPGPAKSVNKQRTPPSWVCQAFIFTWLFNFVVFF